MDTPSADPDIALWYDATLRREIEEDEGRTTLVYHDTMGNSTIGVGRNLSSRGVSNDEIELMLTNDISIVTRELDMHLPFWRTLPVSAQRVYINLCFNMGWPTFSQFHAFHCDMAQYASSRSEQDLRGAISELQDSHWWHQVGDRGPRMINRLVQGHYTTTKGNDNAV